IFTNVGAALTFSCSLSQVMTPGFFSHSIVMKLIEGNCFCASKKYGRATLQSPHPTILTMRRVSPSRVSTSLKNCSSVTSGYANSSSFSCVVRIFSLKLGLPSAHSSHGLVEGSDSTYPIALNAAVIPCPVATPICLNGTLVTSPTAHTPGADVSPSTPTVISPY